ncbi:MULTISPECIES: glycogen debranching N-terminal domain-containing protein [Micromonospora]|uniref:Amylo-alpha-1,6-glucosidase n=1 Tax=Micromonospora solifontis TaxID=2487138 RepID=A0ABX9WJ48_9ACTN|nr:MULTISPECIES: glycogen debranching N-terminal domain-containing protein [Micromonospora]NES13137.1 amylo-alpha-1,6-glucosidase [Micromonospora sp. PPF5-17B]NES36298.1 amylo-alpha-1,6-glucosidase [Micromonospora solifontis]NES55062.1 amylo-alpha-1,6-glucosidase [Micromonospora sp. PPF5-6]RNL99702.1 amylo-alpha-1,6-glucosidase [Micromonospora solifontis]
MKSDLVRVLDGNIFVLSEHNGDIEATVANPCGFFDFDTRFLCRWQLRLNGERLTPLSVAERDHVTLRFFLVPGAPTHYVDATSSVIRERAITGGAFEERLTVLNHDREPVEFTVRLDVASDFAPILSVSEERTPPGRLYRRVEDGGLRLGYRRDRFQRETLITSSEPAQIDEHGLTYTVRLAPKQSWTTTLRVQGLALRPDGQDVREHLDRPPRRSAAERRHDLAAWLDRAPTLSCDWSALTTTYRRSLVDLAALRYSPLTLPEDVMPAAGLPWSATITGRDSILTSFEALPVAPELALATLRMLGIDQGAVLDDFRDEEPGKILHEFRYGEMVAFEERPESPYYGSADATPLYVVLLDEYERWTGDTDLVRQFEDEARAALDWIDEYGDILGDGYVRYRRRNERTGVRNQGWKDTPEAICHADGRLPGPPLATCELQGYAYDAKRRGARLAREFWGDPAYAGRLDREAAALRERFDRDFWLADRGYYALALDGDGRQVDGLASNMGHLLWSGIVPESRAARVVEQLMDPRLFSGWGVRTFAEGQDRYNPLGYHLGAVWPFDNALIAWGLRRYGFAEEAGRIAEAVVDAAAYFDGQLPEAFAGYPRELTHYPVRYPTANSPQALATGAPFLLLRALLGLEPAGEHLLMSPRVPARFGRVELLDVPGRWGRIDVISSGLGQPDR